MSLRHGLLGLLAAEPGSGWDLLRRFENSLAFVWPATQSQLYTELGRLADEELIEIVAVGARNRKEYGITPAGRTELERWVTDVEPEPNVRNEMLLRVFFLWAVSPDQARAYLEREHTRAAAYHQMLVDVRDNFPWDEDEFDRFGRIALENGLRATQSASEWAEWAIGQVKP